MNSHKPQLLQVSVRVSNVSDILNIKGVGSGGKTSSLSKPREAAKTKAPKAGAFAYRKIPISEFRRFYDRGDLPI